jgi:ribonuclease ZC3H12
MLQIAAEFDGVVISGDNFRDLVGEEKSNIFIVHFRKNKLICIFITVRDKIIAERVISPIWVSDDMIIMPEDPYGRFGPKLNDILHRIIPLKETKHS